MELADCDAVAGDARFLRCAIQGWTLSELDSLPVGIALPLREVFQRCRQSPPSGAPALFAAIAWSAQFCIQCHGNAAEVSLLRPCNNACWIAVMLPEQAMQQSVLAGFSKQAAPDKQPQ